MPAAPSGTSLDGASVLVTGGAGFVGSRIARAIARLPGARVVSLDNLTRRGSEHHAGRLAEAGVRFVRGDVRSADDLAGASDTTDVIVDCAAEPSVLAGQGSSSRYVVETNLGGTANVLELARARRAHLVFLSTSRVYPIAALNALAVDETPERFVLRSAQPVAGVSAAGISEAFPLTGVRSLYGATKFASELLIEEYAAAFGVEAVVLRFGVIAGPGQLGRVDQGVFCHWMARHVFGGALRYHGWGGAGQQVRDVVHVNDATALVIGALTAWETARGKTFNAGGGAANALSLRETTAFCAEISGRRVDVGSRAETDASDVRWFVTDHAAVTAALGWTPVHRARAVLEDLYTWMRRDEATLRPFLAS